MALGASEDDPAGMRSRHCSVLQQVLKSLLEILRYRHFAIIVVAPPSVPVLRCVIG
jgi:hypothetical protein